MNCNEANQYAQRLYARVPAHYRVRDREQGYPLLALLGVVGEQADHLRADLDRLWDNFFIETCENWVVPHLAALVGTQLLSHPVGQSNRLDVYNTVLWRRSKGTPAMLTELAQAISGWPVEMAEFFKTLGWSQNLNHIRLERQLTPDLRDAYRLSLLGSAADPFAHAADFKPAQPLAQAPIICCHTADFKPAQPLPQTPVICRTTGISHTSLSTPGRHQIKQLGFFVRRLQTFPLRGVMPANAPPSAKTPSDYFTFDPLFNDTPLFERESAKPLTRAALAHAPWEAFGKDVAVRQYGVLLASDAEPARVMTESNTPFDFGGIGTGIKLDDKQGMELLQPRNFQLGSVHFIISTEWASGKAKPLTLGKLSTLHAALGKKAYRPGSKTDKSGNLMITVKTGSADSWPKLPTSSAGRFPGAVLALRKEQSGPLREKNAVFVYLPATYLSPGQTLRLYIADDGSTWLDKAMQTLARSSEGPVFPPRALTNSIEPASAFTVLNRKSHGLRFPDQKRFGSATILYQVELYTGTFQSLAAIASGELNKAESPQLCEHFPGGDPWKAFTARPSRLAQNDELPDTGLLSVFIKPLTGDVAPPTELILTNRAGRSLLVYLPEVTTAEGARVLVADDGSTYWAEPDLSEALAQRSLSTLSVARHSAGQVLPLPDVWPLQQRRLVALDLAYEKRRAQLQDDELGIDPELGRFALAPGALTDGLSVDYVEAFSGQVGARTYKRVLSGEVTRIVAQADDAVGSAPVYPNVKEAVNAAVASAQENEVIEIVDSATYPTSDPIVLNPATSKKLTIRAAQGQRPCLTFYEARGKPLYSSFTINKPVNELELNGLLLSGTPILINKPVRRLRLIGCTLTPYSTTSNKPWSLQTLDTNVQSQASYEVRRCITGGLRLGSGVKQLTVTDSIINQPIQMAPKTAWAIAGFIRFEMMKQPNAPYDAPAGSLHLERVTVLGPVWCDELHASECLFDQKVIVTDQQVGCVRFCRVELNSVLPRQYRCLSERPLFHSLRFGRPDFAQLAAATPPQLMTASEAGAEIGAFAEMLNQIRLANLQTKLNEYLPAGLTALLIAET